VVILSLFTSNSSFAHLCLASFYRSFVIFHATVRVMMRILILNPNRILVRNFCSFSTNPLPPVYMLSRDLISFPIITITGCNIHIQFHIHVDI